MLKIATKLCFYDKTAYIIRACMSTESKEKWDLYTSVCLERKPVITPALNALETQFQGYLSHVEFEHSLKSDHEIRHENDKKKAELLKKGDTADLDLDGGQLQTAQDFKDACVEELTKFQFANRITDVDKKHDLKSLERKLDQHLVLVTQQQIGKKTYFLPPQGTRQEGESLKQSAERVLKEYCGNEIKVNFFGNAPVGFYKYKYPKDAQNGGSKGAKVFIYFARYLDGKVGDKTEYKWLDRQELSKQVPQDYHRSLSKFLIDERQTETNISC